MPMKKKGKRHVKDFSFVIEEAIKRLPDGENRFALSDYPLSHICLKDFYAPDIAEYLKSDYGRPSSDKEIEKDYYEEISTLEKIMIDADVPISLSDWQTGTNSEAGKRLFKGINRRAYAIQMWDWYGIPWRFKDGFIHLIWSPSDVMGSPIIHSYPVENFLSNLTIKEGKHVQEIEQSNRQLNFWKNFGHIVIAIVSIILIIVLLRVMP